MIEAVVKWDDQGEDEKGLRKSWSTRTSTGTLLLNMTVAQKNGPFRKESQTVVRTDAAYTINDEVDIVECFSESVITIDLPAQPKRGQVHRIMAPTANVTVDGNGHSIADGNTTIAEGRAVDFTFSGLSNVWVSSCEGTT